MPKNYTIDDILNEYSGKEKDKPTEEKVLYSKPKTIINTGPIQNTGYIKIPPDGSIPDITLAYNMDDLEQVNAPKTRPSPSHRSGKFQVSDVSRPNVSYVSSVDDVVKKPADLPPRPTDQIKGYEGAVLTKAYPDDEYSPRVRKMSDSTRAKEMRGKRKKKKQPVFTYDKESPDGAYTRPQKKNKKFVVSHDDGKNKKVDKMAPVPLSKEATPEMLDIEVEQTTENRTVVREEYKKPKKETIRDYDSYEDAKEIRRSITDIKSNMSFRICVLLVIFLFSAFISVAGEIGISLPDFLTVKKPAVFSGIQLSVVLLSMILSADTVKSGLLNLVKFNSDTDSLASFTALASIAASGVCIAYPQQIVDGKICLYAPVAVMAMLINAIGKKLILKRAEINFDFTARERNKHAMFCVEDEIRSESLTRGTIGDFPVLAAMKKTSFLKDFSRYTFSTDSGDKICRPLVPLIALIAAVAAIGLTYLKYKTFDGNAVSYAFYIFTLYISGCSCMALPLTANIPLGKAAKKYSKKHGVMLGYQSIEDFYDTNSVMIDANTLFPSGSISLTSIKVFSDTKVDDALTNAASLTAHANSVLMELFSDIISSRVKILKKVENFVYEDAMGICGWIDNKRILLGNRELMQSHNIEGIPTKTKESEFTLGGKDALYLSVSGNLSAMFIIDITASPAIKKSMKQLEKNDMAVIIKTIDHFVTINRISTIYDFSEDLIRIIPPKMVKDYNEETKKVRKTSTSLACTGKFHSFVNMLMSTKQIKKTVSFGIVLQSVSALLSVGIVSLNFLIHIADLSPAWIMLYNLACTVITAIAVGARKV